MCHRRPLSSPVWFAIDVGLVWLVLFFACVRGQALLMGYE